MIRRRTRSRLVPWLCATVFLALQAVALAHELTHDLRQHNDAACVLHLHAKQSGAPAAAQALFAPVFVADPTLAPGDSVVPFSLPALGYRPRAPPLDV